MRDQLHDRLINSPEARRTWAELDRLRDGDTVRNSRCFVEELKARRERRRRWLTGWGLAGPAAALSLAAASSFLILRPAPATSSKVLATRVGEMRRVTLADGSAVLLNTDTRLRVSINGQARDVSLLAGQARFDVVRDPSRPFRVMASGMTITALGTAFDVVALPRRTAVTLIEGKVLVRTAERSGRAARAVTLLPGQQVAFSAGALSTPRVARIDAALAWQRATVDLSSMTLEQALAEVNRYSTTKIVVADAELGDEQVSGVFKAGDVESVAGALCAFFNLRIVRRGAGEIVLTGEPMGIAAN